MERDDQQPDAPDDTPRDLVPALAQLEKRWRARFATGARGFADRLLCAALLSCADELREVVDEHAREHGAE